MRFSKTRDGVYVAVCNPKASVVPLLMGWFSARFNTQPFIVFDEVHHVAGVSHNGEWQLVRSHDFVVPPAAVDDAFYEQAWKTFYDSVAIDARYNPELRRIFMPKRLWKNIVELSDVSLGGPGIKECDGDVGELENGEGEQVTDLLRRGGMDVVPFGKGSKHAEDEHEQHEVKQAEEHRR